MTDSTYHRSGTLILIHETTRFEYDVFQRLPTIKQSALSIHPFGEGMLCIVVDSFHNSRVLDFHLMGLKLAIS